MVRRILLTASLPYANGPLHLGHILEYVQADVWSRFQTMRGHEAYYICGSDCHGTPIMLRAQKENIAPAELVKKMHVLQKQDLDGFNIRFDQFYTTHSEENQQLASDVYNKLNERGDISTKTIEQAFDPEKQMFLPDRFVKGTCPKCGAEDQYGDNCEVCGATYDPTDLKNPISVLSGATPIQKSSVHYFFELPRYAEKLQNWMQAVNLQKPVLHKMNEWFDSGLQAWDISRDAPYFGFKIPNTEDKYFYVWMDAPIGYMASFKHFCDTQKKANYDDFWRADSDTELYHFVGKDVMYFHTLFWPAMLMGANLKTPNGVYVHGFLTVNGQKMSKSRGTFIKASTYLQHFDPDYLRYYLAAKLNANVEDLDLNLEDFRLRVNSDLVGKLINIASRTAGFITKKFNGRLGNTLDNSELIQHIQSQGDAIAGCYEQRQYAEAMRMIMKLADDTNLYISEKAPWALAKEESQLNTVHGICTTAMNAFRLLMIYLAPVVPSLAEKSAALFNVSDFQWQDTQNILLNHDINTFKPMLTRIEEEGINAMLDESQSDLQAESKTSLTPALKPEITFDDFAKVDLRIAKIIEAEGVEGADKLLRLKVSLGAETRQIFAGVKKAFSPEDIIGKRVVIVANLKPRKMRFGLSEGMMILAVDDKNDDFFLLSPAGDAPEGTPVQ